MIVLVAFLLLFQTAPRVTPTPTPCCRGHVVRPGFEYDFATGQYRRLPTPTRLPRPLASRIRACRNPPELAQGFAGYLDCDVEVVIGTVRDVDKGSSLHTRVDLPVRHVTEEYDFPGNTLVLLDVEEAFPNDPGRTVLFDVGLEDGEGIAKGHRVLATLLRRPADYAWGCGRLRSCKGSPPDVNWVAVELFRPADHP